MKLLFDSHILWVFGDRHWFVGVTGFIVFLVLAVMAIGLSTNLNTAMCSDIVIITSIFPLGPIIA